MLVYLVRHGEALGEMEDPARPLSPRGKEQVKLLAELLKARFRLFPGHIFHSPKTRAAQTAAIISRTLGLNTGLDEKDDLTPMDDPGTWAQRLEEMDRDTMLVGHLPHLPRLASLLLLSDSGRDILNFSPGTVVCLERSGGWRVKWMISPDALKSP
jgi:phosphohistidine phosphatase